MTPRAVEVADLVHDLDSARLTPRIDRDALQVRRLKAAALRSITDDTDADIAERSSAVQLSRVARRDMIGTLSTTRGAGASRLRFNSP